MSTKITKGARLHLLRCAERLQFPMFTIRVGLMPRWTAQQREAWRAMAVDSFRFPFSLPLHAKIEFVTPTDST